MDWFARQPPAGPNGFVKYGDYMALFDPPAQALMSRIQVFKIFAQTVSWASDADLRRIFAGLRQRNIALAIEMGMLTSTDRCGGGVEGYGGQGAVRLAEKIAKLGGELAYIAMDEPVWFGHNFSGTNACRAPLADIARNIAGNIATVRKIFPKVQVGDIEPVAPAPLDGLVVEYEEWVEAYRRASGEPLAFFHADMDWGKPSVGPAARLADVLKTKGVPFGIIYNGSPTDYSDQAWIAGAEAHYEAYEAEGRAPPDQAVFQSWVSRPSHLLPDTDPSAFTYLIKSYFRPRTRITAESAGQAVSGRLVDDRDRPVSGAKIAVTGIDDSGPGFPSQASLRGNVPTGARQAVLGLRINNECECSGAADIGLGTLLYREVGGASKQYRFTPGRDGWREFAAVATSFGRDPSKFHIETTSGQSVRATSPRFTVTEGSEFVLTVPWQISSASEGSGYISVIFLDRDGKELLRTKLPLSPGWAALGISATRPDGRFGLLLPALARLADRLRVVFPGDDRLREAAVVLQHRAPQPR